MNVSDGSLLDRLKQIEKDREEVLRIVRESVPLLIAKEYPSIKAAALLMTGMKARVDLTLEIDFMTGEFSSSINIPIPQLVKEAERIGQLQRKGTAHGEVE